MPEINKDKRDRRQRDECVNQASAHKNAEAISEITHRFREKRIDLSLANVGGDLPFVLGRRDEIAHQKRQQIIINHRTVIVAVQLSAAFLEHGTPQENRAGQRDQAKESAQEIIPAIHERVLQSDVKDRNVLADVHERETNQETRKAGNGKQKETKATKVFYADSTRLYSLCCLLFFG